MKSGVLRFQTFPSVQTHWPLWVSSSGETPCVGLHLVRSPNPEDWPLDAIVFLFLSGAVDQSFANYQESEVNALCAPPDEMPRNERSCASDDETSREELFVAHRAELKPTSTVPRRLPRQRPQIPEVVTHCVTETAEALRRRGKDRIEAAIAKNATKEREADLREQNKIEKRRLRRVKRRKSRARKTEAKETRQLVADVACRRTCLPRERSRGVHRAHKLDDDLVNAARSRFNPYGLDDLICAARPSAAPQKQAEERHEAASFVVADVAQTNGDAARQKHRLRQAKRRSRRAQNKKKKRLQIVLREANIAAASASSSAKTAAASASLAAAIASRDGKYDGIDAFPGVSDCDGGEEEEVNEEEEEEEEAIAAASASSAAANASCDDEYDDEYDGIDALPGVSYHEFLLSRFLKRTPADGGASCACGRVEDREE
jgi:hypothetical protein